MQSHLFEMDPITHKLSRMVAEKEEHYLALIEAARLQTQKNERIKLLIAIADTGKCPKVCTTACCFWAADRCELLNLQQQLVYLGNNTSSQFRAKKEILKILSVDTSGEV